MDAEIVLKNYRCFSDEQPARFQLRNGFVSLVGINNAGKSTLLKFFYEFRQFFEVLSSGQTSHALNQFVPQGVKDFQEVFHNDNQRNISIQITILDNPSDSNNSVTFNYDRTTRAVTPEAGSEWIWPQRPSPPVPATPSPFRDFANDCRNAMYIPAFRNAINQGSHQNYFDILVGDGLNKKFGEIKVGEKQQARLMTKKISSDLQHIFRFDNLEIDAAPHGQTLHMFVDGKSLLLQDVGAGIAHFFIVLLNAALHSPTWILIDEPELSLHPTLQLDFVTALASYASRGIIFSTHSYGLARAASDQIYVFRREKTRSVMRALEEIQSPSLSEFLGELSFSGYNELGFNKILLVEGPTEVRSFQQLLRKHKKDHEIVILPLCGSSLINSKTELELSEILRISKHISAVIDSELDAPGTTISKERQEFKSICDKLQIHCHILERRAFENYLTERAVQQEKGQQYKALGPFDKLKDAPLPWSKAENWRIAGRMSLEDIEGNDLGRFVAEL